MRGRTSVRTPHEAQEKRIPKHIFFSVGEKQCDDPLRSRVIAEAMHDRADMFAR